MLASSLEIDLKYGDFRELVKSIPDGSIDLILTDPPYPKRFLQLWNLMGKAAARVLKRGGYLITLAGHAHLPKVISYLESNLQFYWIGWLVHNGAHASVPFRSLQAGGKPILYFSKGEPREHTWFVDTITSPERDKRYHEWGQNISPFKYLILNFTREGDRVLDPFVGGGTTLMACKLTNRNGIGFENNEDAYLTSFERLSALDNLSAFQSKEVLE